MNSKRIDVLEKELKRVKQDVKEVEQVQGRHKQLIHGLEKVTRGHNIRVFGLDKAYLLRENLIDADDYHEVLRFLLLKGLQIPTERVDEIFRFLDTCHELATGFIASFTRRDDRGYVLSRRRNLANWAPCASVGPRYKFVSVQIDLPDEDQKEKKKRNDIVDKYKKAGYKAKFVGWNKIAIGDGPAKHYKEFPPDPTNYDKNRPSTS